jgi:hypothetical protein
MKLFYFNYQIYVFKTLQKVSKEIHQTHKTVFCFRTVDNKRELMQHHKRNLVTKKLL